MVTVKLSDPKSVWTVATGRRFRLQSSQADFRELLHAKLSTEDMVGELERRTREVTLLSPMTNLLQSCACYAEAYTVITQVMPQMFPNKTGVLYCLSVSRTLVDALPVMDSDRLVGTVRLADLLAAPLPASFSPKVSAQRDEAQLLGTWRRLPVRNIMTEKFVALAEETP